MADLTRMC